MRGSVMFDFVHEEAVPAEDRANSISIVLILVIICLGNLVLALSNDSYARALELMGWF